MNWYKYAQKNDLGKDTEIIKHTLKTHPFLKGLLHYYHIPEEDIDNDLKITISDDLGDRYAQGNGEEIQVNSKIFNGEGLLEDKMHFVIHEFQHWLKRRAEANFYFNDPEEVQSFTLGMAWEFLRGKTKEHVIEVFYPIISGHFKNPEDAEVMFHKMLEESLNLVETHNRESHA